MSFEQLVPDLDAARRYLAFLDATAVANGEKFLFLWLPPGKQAGSGTQELLTTDQFCRVLPGKQSMGFQPFVCVNKLKGSKRSNAEVSGYRAFFLDFDGEPAHAPDAYPPHCIVQSKGGQHWYWRTSGDPPQFWRSVTIALAHYFGSDITVTDPARVLRVPGSWHLKDPEDPFLVTLQKCEPPPVVVALGSIMPAKFPLNMDAANHEAERLMGAAKAPWAGGSSKLPPNLAELLGILKSQGRPIWHTEGRPEWYTKCPLRDHSHARVCIYLQSTGDFSVFCQSKKHGCTSDAILADWGVGWAIRYQNKY